MPTQPAHILLLGGSGRTGQLVLAEALRRSHPVIALVRRATSLAPTPGLSIIEGTPLNKSDIEKAIASIPQSSKIFIISTLSQTRVSGNPWSATTSPKRLMADAIDNVIAISKVNRRIEKLVVMSMFGAGNSFGNLMFLMRWIMNTSNMDVTLGDHNLVDKAVKASGLNFVMVRSAMLKGEEVAAVIDLGDDGEKAGMMPSVSRRSVAGFLLDAAEQNIWDRRTPVISN
jgi:NAD(P)H-binding